MLSWYILLQFIFQIWINKIILLFGKPNYFYKHSFNLGSLFLEGGENNIFDATSRKKTPTERLKKERERKEVGGH